MTLNDLEPPKGDFSVWFFFKFSAAAHILRVDFAEMAGDR